MDVYRLDVERGFRKWVRSLAVFLDLLIRGNSVEAPGEDRSVREPGGRKGGQGNRSRKEVGALVEIIYIIVYRSGLLFIRVV
ncbi:MAG: hypothetical protein ACREIQ_13180, partial [Nitrospiria bacterium]